MAKKPKTPMSETVPTVPIDAQQQQAGRRLNAEHRRLKIAFADAYVELMGFREENARLNAILAEQQRVMREMSAKLPKDKPKKDATPKS